MPTGELARLGIVNSTYPVPAADILPTAFVPSFVNHRHTYPLRAASCLLRIELAHLSIERSRGSMQSAYVS